jgi:hypothetical protein
LDIFAAKKEDENLITDILQQQERIDIRFFERIVSILPLHVPNMKP